MPYTVTSNADGCEGFAVVKEGEKTPIPGGCHQTKSSAIAHMVAVQSAYEDGQSRAMEIMEDEGDLGEQNLLPRQTAMYELYESIAEDLGQWNQGTGANGAHYGEVSPFQSEGVICGNCVFYEGGQRCELVAGQIKPLGICKLWIIEESLLAAPGIKMIDGEPEEEPSEYSTRASANLVAPAFMKASAQRGLALHEEGYSGDGLRPQTVEDARKMANGTALSPAKWRKISPWIARHTVDLNAVQGDEITAGLVAMLLWGGGSSKSSAARAQSYAERIVAQLEEDRAQPRDQLGRFGSGSDTGSLDEAAKEIWAQQDQQSITTISGTMGDPNVVPLENELFFANESYNNSLSDEQVGVLKDYTNNLYEPLNTALRGAPPPPPNPYKAKQALKKGEVLEKTIADAPGISQTVTVYRGMSEDAHAALSARTGKTFTDRGFTSTSLSLKSASNFQRGDAPLMRITVRKGAKAIPMEKWHKAFHNSAEHEVLIQRGSKFKITKVSKDFIDVELVGGA